MRVKADSNNYGQIKDFWDGKFKQGIKTAMIDIAC